MKLYAFILYKKDKSDKDKTEIVDIDNFSIIVQNMD